MLVANDEQYGLIDNSQQDEYQIVLKASNGDKIALEYIIKKYKNFVKAKAKSYFLIGADKEDIIQEGMIGNVTSLNASVAGGILLYEIFKQRSGVK